MSPHRDRRMELMQELGDVYLYQHRPFEWRVRHDGVVILDDDDELVPEGTGTNTMCAADDHWRQLTEPGTRVRSFRLERDFVWETDRWRSIP